LTCRCPPRHEMEFPRQVAFPKPHFGNEKEWMKRTAAARNFAIALGARGPPRHEMEFLRELAFPMPHFGNEEGGMKGMAAGRRIGWGPLDLGRRQAGSS
jgi:hypothetical protein